MSGLWHGIVDFVVGDDLDRDRRARAARRAAAAVHFGADAWWLLAAGVPGRALGLAPAGPTLGTEGGMTTAPTTSGGARST